MRIGSATRQIRLELLNSGTYTGYSTILGDDPGENGYVFVDGENSVWTNTNLTVGFYGTGTFRAEGGATVDMTAAATMGTHAGSKGRVEVSGPGTTWKVGGAHIIGDSGIGEFILSDGAVVSDAAMSLGQTSTGNGFASASGAGTRWNSAGTMMIGASGTGRLEVLDGAVVEAGIYGQFGRFANSSGELLVSGAGSTFKTGNYSAIGNLGDGSVLVSNGGTVDTKSGIVGWANTAEGSVRVTGAGSRWLGTTYLLAGNEGKGTVTVDSGGLISIDGGAGRVILANVAGAEGVLNVGAAEGDAARASGTVDVSEIRFGPGAATLVLNHTDTNYALSPDFSFHADSTAAIKHLSGVTTLTGDGSPFAGATEVTGGTLRVNQALGGTMSVSQAGTLGGTGTVGATTIGSGGTLAPGNSIGTITVSDSLTFAGGSNYVVEIGAQADRTNVLMGSGTGIATLTGGTVVPVYDPEAFISSSYIILEAEGGLAGTTFAGMSSAGTGSFTHSLLHDGNQVRLLVDFAPGGGATLTPNQQAVVDALAAAWQANGGIPGQAGLLTPAQLTVASGETGASAMQAGNIAVENFLNIFGDPAEVGPTAPDDEPMAYAATGSAESGQIERRFEAGFATGTSSDAGAAARFEAWGSVMGRGEWLAGNAAVGSQDVSAGVFGIASGGDYIAGGTRLGLGLGASWTGFSSVNGAGSGRIGTFNVGARASHDFGNVYLAGSLAYGFHDVATTRTLAGDTYSAAFTGHSVSGRAETGYRWRTGAADMLPYAAFQATSFSNPAYTETAAGAGALALTYGAATSTESRSEIGARFARRIAHGQGALTLSGRIAWAHYFNPARSVTAGFAAIPGTSFVTRGAGVARNTALVSAGAEYAWGAGKSATISLDGEFGAGTTRVGGKAGFKITW